MSKGDEVSGQRKGKGVYVTREDYSKSRKLALPYHGQFRVVEVLPNGVSVIPVDHPQDELILVNVDWVTSCPDELPDTSWLGSHRKKNQKTKMPKR